LSIPQPDAQAGTVYPVPAYLSPSSIETFITCPLKYKYSRIDKMYDPPTVDAARGNFVHECLEALFALPAAERTEASARAIMARLWVVDRVDRWGEAEQPWCDEVAGIIGSVPHVLRKFRWQAWWCVENYFALENPALVEPTGIEHELIGFIGEVPIKGYIDRWSWLEGPSDGIVVTDYKTGKTPRPQYRPAKFQQLLIYADALAAELDATVSKVELLYLKDGTRLTKAVRKSDIESMRTTVTNTYNGIIERCEYGTFEPTPNKLCDWCSFKNICPAWKN
jgi:putative RecB family exonuclease